MNNILKNKMDYLERNKDISTLSNFKTPAKTEYYFEVSTEDDIKKIFEIYQWAKMSHLPLLLVSWGTNMLFAFENYHWIIIKNNLFWWTYDRDTKILESYSQESIWEIAEILESEYNQDLWHRFIGLPGTIGWAVYWNAWCFWLETANNFVDVRVLDVSNGENKIFSKWEMEFEYRHSRLKNEKKYFIISARFDLSQKIEKYHSDVDNIDFRNNKQPNWNSCGSFFKNPSKDVSAGQLIEAVWLKWYKLWGAYYSEKHANFLMHDGHWTYKDLLALIDLAQKKVYDAFAIDLENEVQIIINQ